MGDLRSERQSKTEFLHRSLGLDGRVLKGTFPLALAALTTMWGLSLITAPEPAAAEERFVLVMDGAAVKDHTSGLIWEQTPDSIHDSWAKSLERCTTKTVGGQKGWRAPTVEELKMLIDSDQKNPALPQGHPFSNIKSAIYWTATPSPTDEIVAWLVSFFSGEAFTDQKSGNRRVWCVLGGRGGDK